MAVRRTWGAGLAICATAASIAALAVAAPASAGAFAIRHFKPGRVINYQPAPRISSSLGAVSARAALPGGLPVFSHTQTDPLTGTEYHYEMVGKNPQVAQSVPATTVATKVIPLKIVLPDGTTHNPAKKNRCDSQSALTRVLNSPLFVKQDWSFQGTDVGTTQYVDAFQRAEFAQYTNSLGINSGYHVTLKRTRLAVATVHVPAKAAAIAPGKCATSIGIKIQWLNNYLVNTLLPKLAKAKLVGPATFPLFIMSNTVAYDRTPDNCCILGYHSAFANRRGKIQTFGIADYENSGAFSRKSHISDIEIATHEVAEWMDDPLGKNATPAWSGGQVTNGCQTNLEVGDPLTGTTIADKVGTFTYHVQELAFMSWFYHQSPSVGVNGLYSNNGTFVDPAAPCG